MKKERVIYFKIQQIIYVKKSVEIKIRYDKINLEKKEGDLNFWI